MAVEIVGSDDGCGYSSCVSSSIGCSTEMILLTACVLRGEQRCDLPGVAFYIAGGGCARRQWD